MNDYICEYGHGICKAPDTNCPHWIGTYCELDYEYCLKYNLNLQINKNDRKEKLNGRFKTNY